MRLPLWNELTAASLKPALRQLFIGVMALVAIMWMPSLGKSGRSPYRSMFQFERYTWLEWFFAAVALVVIVVSVIQLRPLLRHTMRARGPLAHREFARAGMPRTIYELLLGIAAVDGHIDGDERDVVAAVMTRKSQDIVTPQDLQNWKSTVEPPRDPVQLARRLATLMTEHERTALWEWCREVAAVDGTDEDEHDVLRRIRAVLKPIDVSTWRRG